MEPHGIAHSVRDELRRRGTTPFRAAVDAGLPDNAIRHLLDGHEPRVGRLAEICAALGWEFYVGPQRAGPAWGPLAVSAGLPGLADERLGWVAGDFERYDQLERRDFLERFRTAFTWLLGSESAEALPPVPAPAQAPARTQSGFAEGLALAPDRRLVEISAVLGDAFDELNERGRQDLMVRFWSAFPDLREREPLLARVVGWLGWRVIEGRDRPHDSD